MNTARLFRLYRLVTPSGCHTSASKKILEPIVHNSSSGSNNSIIVRRFAFCPEFDNAGKAANRANPMIVRFCSSTIDGSKDVSSTTAEATVDDHVQEAAVDEPVQEAATAIDYQEDIPAVTESVDPQQSDEPESSEQVLANDAATPVTDETSSPDVIPPTSSSETVPPPPPPPPTSAGLHVHTLPDRALVRIEGVDTQSLLQGLVTQDLELLNQTDVVYAMMLNLQGRVLYDVLIYNISSPRSEIQKYLVECDAEVALDLISHLKKYKLRKNCDIVNVSNIYEVSAVQPKTERMSGIASLPRKSEFAEAFDPLLVACRDPRLKDIGWRVISGKGFDVSEALGGGAICRPIDEYREHRYKLGVGEGIVDMEPGKSFPLQSNLVFLNGVSFSKGCYLGQELTARTHHTGVIRKRIMPLILSTPISPDDGPFTDNLILNTGGKDAGKFRSGVGVHGIGLVRVNMSGGRLIIVGKGKESECYARMPAWWPMDDPEAVLGAEQEEEPEPEQVELPEEKTAQTSNS